MRLLAKPEFDPPFWARITRPCMLGLGILALGLAGPALGGREAPAVWVPLAPVGAENPGVNPPIVLVPYRESLYLPAPGQEPAPWVPDYLASPGPGLGADPLEGAAQAGQWSRDLRADAAEPQEPQEEPQEEEAPAFTLSDVLRDAGWRRETAERLRRSPSFKPRF